MNRSYSKIRHIQEANQQLEKRILNEQSSRMKRKVSSDLEAGDILIVTDKKNRENKIEVNQLVPTSGGLVGILNNSSREKFLFGVGENQLKFINTEPTDFDFTINKVEISGKQFPVNKDGSF